MPRPEPGQGTAGAPFPEASPLAEPCADGVSLSVRDAADAAAERPCEAATPAVRDGLRVGGLTYLGQVADTYLILRDEEGALLLLDQHAAHERVLYARLARGAFGGAGQCLALPLELPLQAVEEERFFELRPRLQKMGFGLE